MMSQKFLIFEDITKLDMGQAQGIMVLSSRSITELKSITNIKLIVHIIVIFCILCMGAFGQKDTPHAPLCSISKTINKPSGSENPICPEIALNIRDHISFDSDSKWEPISIGMYIPKYCRLGFCTIKPVVPDGWDFKVDLDHESPFLYDPIEGTFWINGFGNGRDNVSISEPFFIKPQPFTQTGIYNLTVEYDLAYVYKLDNIVTPIRPEPLVGVMNLTLVVMGSDSLDPPKPSQNESPNSTPETKPSGENDPKNNNIWIFSLVSALCAIVLVIYGPGNYTRAKRINGSLAKMFSWIRRKIR